MAGTAANIDRQGGLGLPAPLVRVLTGPHIAPGAFGASWTMRDVVEVAATDVPDAAFGLDLRVELLRRRKKKNTRSDGRSRGFQWVHPADHDGQANVLDGGRTRGGNQYADNGTPMVARVTTVPVAAELTWVPVELAGWWKQGSVELHPSNTFIDVPVSTGSQVSQNRYDIGPGHLPQWKGIGGNLRQRFAFRLSCIDPNGTGDLRDRITGPISAARVVQRPIRNGTDGSPVWPDGAGGAAGEDTSRIGTWLEEIS